MKTTIRLVLITLFFITISFIAVQLFRAVPALGIGHPGNLTIDAHLGGIQNFNQVGIGGDVTGGTAKLYVNGNVGIGTTSPGANLHILSTTEQLRLGYDTSNYESFTVNNSGNLTVSRTQGGGSTPPLTDPGVTFSNAVLLSSDLGVIGNVGIGTTTPAHALQVVNYSTNNARISLGTVSSLELLAFDPLTTKYGDISNNASFATGSWVLGDPTREAWGIGMASNSSNTGNMDFFHSNNTTFNQSIFMRITGSGNVGIGTTAPYAKLDVNGTIRAINQVAPTSGSGAELTWDGIEANLRAYNRTSPGYLPLYLDGSKIILNNGSSGNVGIGTTSPAGKLQVVLPVWINHDTDSQHAIFGSGIITGTGQDGVRIGYNDTNNFGVINALKPGSAWGNLILQDGGGKVGIGTTSPSHLFQLSGGAYSDGSTWQNSSSRDVKENFTALNPYIILQKINQLPITEWNYKTEDPSAKHIGPVAEDFYSLFGLNGTDKAISTIDPSGVALIGIQALAKNVATISAQVNKLSSFDYTSMIQTQRAEITDLQHITKFININSEGGAIINENSQVKDIHGNLITQIAAFAEAVVGHIKVGLLEAKQIIVNGVDVGKKLNDLTNQVNQQQQEINQLKETISNLKIQISK